MPSLVSPSRSSEAVTSRRHTPRVEWGMRERTSRAVEMDVIGMSLMRRRHVFRRRVFHRGILAWGAE